MHARATFSESGPVFSSSNFGIKKTHSLARTVVVGRLFTMIDITATTRYGTLYSCVVLYASRECVSSRFWSVFSRASLRENWLQLVWFFSFPQIHTKLPLKAQCARVSRHALCARKRRRPTPKRPTTKKSLLLLLLSEKARHSKNAIKAMLSEVFFLAWYVQKKLF